MNGITSPNQLRLRYVALALSCAFPSISNAASVTSYEFISPQQAGDLEPTLSAARLLPPAEESSFDRSQTVSLHSLWYPNASFDGTARATYDGSGHFGASILIDQKPPLSAQTPLLGGVRLVYQDEIVNTSSLTQAASFSLAINTLNLTVAEGAFPRDVKAAFRAKVFANGSNVPLWQTHFDYKMYNSIMDSGDDLGLERISRGTYKLSSPFSKTLNLGEIAPNEHASIRYEVDIAALSSGYGGSVSLVFDDPSQIALGNTASMAPTAQLSFAQPVPEPETYAMMAVGLGLIGAAARRRRQNKH